MKIKKLIMFVSSLVLSAACIMGASCTPADTGDSGDNNQNQEQPGEDNPGEDNPGEDNPGEDNPGEDNPGEDNPGEDNPGEDNPGEDNPGEDVPVVSDTVTFAQTANESAAFEWEESSASGASVEYKLSSDSAYTPVDEELIRQISDDTARVDILGLKGGENYDFRITTGADEVIDIPSVAISAYDRSGYAHFNYSDGVGAYNDDGTLKDNAIVVYVSEETKNSAITVNGRTYDGLVDLLQNATTSGTPIAIRVLGQISAATWNPKTLSETQDALEENLPDNNRFTEEQIISAGINTLNTTTYSVLEGLTNRISYSRGEFDSRYNDCSIDGAQNVTLEGVGTDAKIFQWGMTWSNSTSIEVRNLTFDDYTEDACSFQGDESEPEANTESSPSDFNTQRVWFHHNTVNQGMNYWDVTAEQDKHEGDGGTDLTRVSYVSVAYNHYYNCHKTGLVGGGNSVRGANITFHHNWYEQCGSRLPLGRQANMHMYNNYYDGSTSENMSIRAGAFAFIENCYFDNANRPIRTQDGDGRKGFAKVYNSIFVGDQIESGQNVTEVDDRAERVGNTDNFLGEEYYYFDTNSDVFYYDEANNRSDVEVMHDTSEIPTLVPSLAGTLHRSFNVDIGNASYKETQQSVVTTYSATAVGDRIVLSANAGVNFSCSGGIDSDETQKYSVSNDRINLGGNAAYIKFSVAAKVGQKIKVTVNAAAAADSGISVQSDRAIPSGDTAAALDKNYKDCVFTFTTRSDDTFTFTVRRNVASTVYVKSITVQVSG